MQIKDQGEMRAQHNYYVNGSPSSMRICHSGWKRSHHRGQITYNLNFRHSVGCVLLMFMQVWERRDRFYGVDDDEVGGIAQGAVEFGRTKKNRFCFHK